MTAVALLLPVAEMLPRDTLSAYVVADTSTVFKLDKARRIVEVEVGPETTAVTYCLASTPTRTSLLAMRSRETVLVFREVEP